ncbi:MAG: SDR family oxidoreductase [Saprospiraceae bacterium]|nr:SDR family oxidoreductase [Saprospiraceae bacterium]
MDSNLTRWAVITGISKGIGKAIALRLAQEGFSLIGCARGQKELDLLVSEIHLCYPDVQIRVTVADLADPQQVNAFAQFATGITAHVHLLVNNAGLFMPGSVLGDTAGHLETMMQINLYSAYHITRALAPAMVTQRSGHIFNLCSVASLQAYPGGATYAITKFAMLGFSRSLREELRSSGVRVTTLLPGATWSDSWAGVDLPQDRLMPASDIADILWSAYSLSPNAVVEEILLRPQLGDL